MKWWCTASILTLLSATNPQEKKSSQTISVEMSQEGFQNNSREILSFGSGLPNLESSPWWGHTH